MLSFHIPSRSCARKQAAKLSSFSVLRGWGLLSTQGLLAQALDVQCMCVLDGAQSSQKSPASLSRNVEHRWVLLRVVAEFACPLCLIWWGESCS